MRICTPVACFPLLACMGAMSCLGQAPIYSGNVEMKDLNVLEAPGAVACVRLALEKGGKNYELIRMLCASAASEAPSICIGSMPTWVEDLDKLKLCSSAIKTSLRAPTMCAKALGRSLDATQRERLCAGSASKSAGTCFVATTKRLNALERIALCTAASSGGVAQCAVCKALRSTKGEHVPVFCRNTGNTTSAECYDSVARHILDRKFAAVACAGASNVMPATCFRAIEKRRRLTGKYDNMPYIQTVSFCRCVGEANPRVACIESLPSVLITCAVHDGCARIAGAAPPVIAAKLVNRNCYEHAKKSLRDEDLATDLCLGATTATAGICASQAPDAMKPTDKLLLCRSLVTTSGSLAGRVACAMLAHRVRYLRRGASAVAASLCANAVDDAPAKCALNIPGIRSTSEFVQALCGAAKNTPGMPNALVHPAALCVGEIARHVVKQMRAVPYESLVTLCAGIETVNIAKDVTDCAVRMVGTLALESKGISVLCRSERISNARACFEAAPITLDASTRAELCENSPRALSDGSFGPVECAKALRDTQGRRFNPIAAVSICHMAKSATPAYCAARDIPYRVKPLSGAFRGKVLHCKQVRSVPTQLRLHQVYYFGIHDGKPLVERKNLQVTVHILDQYGIMMRSDSEVVVASIPAEKSQGATLNGIRVNTSIAGSAIFRHLQVTKPGNFTLKFRVAKTNVKAAIFLNVMADPDYAAGSPAGQCGAALVDLMRCLPTPHTRDGHTAIDTFTSVLPANAFIVGPLAGCELSLASSGFALTSAWGGKTWITYRTALAWIEAVFVRESSYGASNVPTEGMSYEARLQLHQYDKSDHVILKSHYRRLSRDWHPDRWVGFPKYQSIVTRIFELLNDAYEGLG